jgi:hypothetical protein
MTETATAGATPVVGGATPPQSPPAQPAAAAPSVQVPSATDDYPEGLGDAGKRALDRMKAERDAATASARTAEKERDELKAKGVTESERAVADAKKAGAAEVTERFHGQIRRAEVRAALTSAGINASVLDLAAKADEFAALTVTDSGEVSGLDAAVEAFKRARSDLFGAKTTPRPGDAGLGPRGTPSTGGTDLNTWIRKEAGRA